MSVDPSLLFLGQQNAPAPTQNDVPPARDEDMDAIPIDESQAGRDRTLAELLYQLCPPSDSDQDPSITSLIPDNLLSYYLERSGFQTDNIAVTRLIGLATQKFMHDIISDSYQYARSRTMASTGGATSTGGQVGRPSNASRAEEADDGTGTGKGKKKAGVNVQGGVEKNRTVLTMEDLNNALEEYGIQAGRAPYYL